VPVRIVAAAIVVAAAALCRGTGAGAAGNAISPTNTPTPLAGAENGYVPDSRLLTAIPGCKTAREAAPSLALLYRLAAASRVTLRASDCYRAIGGQVAAQQSWTARGNSTCAAAPTTYPDGRPKGTSNHGWGKAVDVGEPGSVSFSSAGYRFLKAAAAQLGWNHPGWAEPRGSACPEPWHWEWVGDGGTAGGDPIVADVVAALPGADGRGRLLVTGLGDVRSLDGAEVFGTWATSPISAVVVGAASTPTRRGYWMAGADGGFETFGDATFSGSLGATRLNAPILAMAATPSGKGYWLLGADGGIFTFGDATFTGSLGATRLNAPILAMAATPSGKGYRLLASDGGIFTFGDATFTGSAVGRMASVAVALAPGDAPAGYAVVGADGSVAAFG
jgi:hypothetical protein